jgi:excisionase family DNA binding protein
VTIETEESILLRDTPVPRSSLLWCPDCRRRVSMITPEQAAQIGGVSSRTIYRWVEERNLHFVEARDGPLLICEGSLRRWKSLI